METKTYIWIGIFVGSTAGGLLGSLFDGGLFGAWGIILSTVGGFVGIWIGYKIGNG